MIAAAGSSPEMVQTVLKYHPPADVADDGGDTALMTATSLDRPDNVRLLLEYGADPHLKNKKGETVFTIAKKKHSPRLDAILKSVGAKFPHSP